MVVLLPALLVADGGRPVGVVGVVAQVVAARGPPVDTARADVGAGAVGEAVLAPLVVRVVGLIRHPGYSSLLFASDIIAVLGSCSVSRSADISFYVLRENVWIEMSWLPPLKY